MTIHLETPRLLIREAVMDDAQDLLALFNDAMVLRFNPLLPTCLERVQKAIAQGNHPYCIQLKGGPVVGAIFAEQDDLRYQVNSLCLSYQLRSEYTGHGYMTEAMQGMIRYGFTALGADVLAARVFADNQRSLKLIRRLGFRQEGVLRRAVRTPDGIIHDDCLFALMKEEWKA